MTAKQSSEKNQELEALLEFIRESRGFDFTGYKRSSLIRRITKRMQTVNVDGVSDYKDYLEVEPEEFIQLFNTILINVTKFFRDPEAWNCLAEEVIPSIVDEKSSNEPIRAWSVGCASGEEAYTVAIVLAEALGKDEFRKRVKIYATDVDEEALDQARHAHYRDADLESVPDKLRKKYFKQVGDRFAFSPDLRRSVIFGTNDAVQNAPISHLDLLVCRNTLMYFNSEIQNRILARFHFALNDNGVLFLGKAETMLTRARLFMPVNLKHRIFQKVARVPLRNHALLMAQIGNAEAGTQMTRGLHLREAAFETTPAAQLVVDMDGVLTSANNEARSLLDVDTRDLGRPFHELRISYEPIELRKSIEQAYADGKAVLLHDVERPLPDGKVQYLNVHVLPLFDNQSSTLGVSITFTDETRCKQLERDLGHANQELETANEELQSANEELETTNEELQSSNEELETTNEELQSTNEEMETMNEELQATNEQLRTINDELNERSDLLNQTNSFLESILTGLRIGVVVVDSDIKILRWNTKSNDLWGLRADEVKDQFLLNLDIGLPVNELKGPIRAILNGKVEVEELQLDATNRRGKSIRCGVTCTPLIGTEKEIQGVIVLMEEL